MICTRSGGNLALTATLSFRYCKNRAGGSNPAIAEAILQILKQRIFRSRSERVALWRSSARERTASLRTSVNGEIPTGTRPRISVCMAAYNGEQFIAPQLRSILSQLAEEDEVILVDDASTDDTCRIIESFQDARLRLARHESNQGVLRSFEDAIQRAEGDILFLADQDDLWMDDKVSTVLNAFRSDLRADIVVSDAALMNEDGTPTSPSYYANRGKFQSGILANVLHCRYLGCTMAFRSRIYSRILPFPKGGDIHHDLWIGTSNSLAGGNTLYIDRPLVHYRRHGGNATGNKRLSLMRQIRIRWDLCRALAASWLKLHRIGDQ